MKPDGGIFGMCDRSLAQYGNCITPKLLIDIGDGEVDRSDALLRRELVGSSKGLRGLLRLSQAPASKSEITPRLGLCRIELQYLFEGSDRIGARADLLKESREIG